jgi:2'-5' RNA ligase
MRTFVALPLPDAVLDPLEAVQAGLMVGRIVPRENLHLTLAFLDEQPDAVLDEMHHALRDLAAAPVPLAVGGLGVFGGARPRVLYATVAPDPALARLRSRVRSAARQAGITLPHERFVPHVTLARFRPSEADVAYAALGPILARHAGFRAPEVTLYEIVLMASTLAPAGARYEELARYALDGDG